MPKPSVYAFSDFASLFAAQVEWLKSANPRFSWRWLAKRLALKSHTYLLNLANGAKLPTDDMLGKLADVFGLTLDEHVYVKALIGLQAARNDAEKEFFQTKLAEMKRDVPARLLELDAFASIAHWHHLAIYEMVALPGFRSDPAWIAARMGHAVTADTVAEAIERLVRLGLLARSADGSLTRAVDGFVTTHNVPSAAISTFHKQMLERATAAIDGFPVPERMLFGYTMPFASARLAEAQNLIVEFRARFARLLEGGAADGVYHLAIQFFPLTVPTGDAPSSDM